MGYVPKGTFLAGEDPEQIVAMKWAHELGEELARKHPEIADRWRDLKAAERTHEIAEDLLPEIFERNPEVVRVAVSYALGLLLSPKERATLTAERLSLYAREQLMAMSPEDRSARATKAVQRRNELHGTNVAALLKGRGRTAWSKEEGEKLLALMKDPFFLRPKGRQGGRPDLPRIAMTLNNEFHDKQQIRSPKTVADHRLDLQKHGFRHQIS